MINEETIREYESKNKLDPEDLLKILSDEMPYIYVIVNQGEKIGVTILYRKTLSGKLMKPLVKRYKWYPESREFRAFFCRHSRKYHRIILPDLLRGTDAYGNKISWFETKEEAELYLGLI